MNVEESVEEITVEADTVDVDLEETKTEAKDEEN